MENGVVSKIIRGIEFTSLTVSTVRFRASSEAFAFFRVNLALHILNDAWADAYDCAVIVSNDSDLATALKMVREQHKKVIGLITPGAPKRNPSWQLRQFSSFIKIIRPWALEKSLLPNPIPGSEISKPKSW